MSLMDMFTALTATYLEQGVRAGFLRADLDPQVAARVLGALMAPGMVRVVRGRFPTDVRERYERGLTALIADGVHA